MLTDIRMPRMDGLAAIRGLLALDPAPAVVALTTFDLDDYLFGALQAGAVGFLLKESDPGLIIEAVRVAHHGQGLGVRTRVQAAIYAHRHGLVTWADLPGAAQAD